MRSTKSKVSPQHIGGMQGGVEDQNDGEVIVHVTRSGDYENDAWYREELKEKVCSRFVPDPNTKHKNGTEPDKTCYCGYSYDSHSTASIKNGQSSSHPWDGDKDISLQPTSAFGELEFVGRGHKSKFARAADDTCKTKLKSLLMDQWKLKEPTAIISMTGGAEDFTMKSDLGQVVEEGLMKAVMVTSAWVITGGMHAGVMKHVGKAAKTSDFVVGYKKKATVIGIAPWGCVANRHALISSIGKWPAEYEMTDERQNIPGECVLDLNHTHFILFDNGMKNKSDTEHKVRSKLEATIGEIEGKKVPRVCVLLEGGPGSLETVKSAVENNTPVIIASGSGRCADIITYALLNAEIDDSTSRMILPEKSKLQLRNMLSNMFGSSPRSESLKDWTLWVEKCIENKHLITICSMDGTSDVHKDIDTCILTGLLKAKTTDLREQLETLLLWNRVDIAKTQIVEARKLGSNQMFIDLMKDALTKGREDFLLLFLQNGMNVEQNLDVDTLVKLYRSTPESNPLYHLLDINQNFTLSVVGKLIKDLIGNYYEEPLYLSKKYQGRDHFSEPSRELFIWAVLMNLKTIAKHFWVEVSSPIASALTACELLRGMVKVKEIGDAYEKKSYKETATEFESLAVAVLQESYTADREKAQDLLMREQPNFGHTTCLQLARHSSLEVMAHPCTQTLLDRYWNGILKPSNPWWRILPCVVFLPLACCLPQFIEGTHKKEDDNSEKTTTGGSNYFESGQNFPDDRRDDESEDFPDERRDEDSEEGNRQHKDSIKNKAAGDNGDIFHPTQPHFYVTGRRLGCRQRMVLFNAVPRVRFMQNCINYIIFLILCSCDLLLWYSERPQSDDEAPSEQPALSNDNGTIQWEPYSPVAFQYYAHPFLLLWVLSLFFEELQQAVGNFRNIKTNICSYFRSIWNIIDILAVILHFIASGLRLSPDNTTYEAGRYVMCCSLFLFFLRILQIFRVFKHVGPTLTMIWKMLRDLRSFMLIIAVFMFAYGVVRQVILHRDSPFSDGMLLYTLMRASYWQMFAELGHFFQEHEGDDKHDENSTCVLKEGVLENCSPEQILAPIVKGIYLLFINILMFNLLIAMFNYTYTKVRQNKKKIWSFQRYSLIKEYYYKLGLLPPFYITFHIGGLIHNWYKKRTADFDTLKLTFTTLEEKQREQELIAWEEENADEYRRKRLIDDRKTTEYKIKEKVEELNGKVESNQERLLRSAEKVERIEEELKRTNGSLERTNESLEWIIRYLTSGSRGTSMTSGLIGQASTNERMGRAVQERSSLDSEHRRRWPNLFDDQN